MAHPPADDKEGEPRSVGKQFAKDYGGSGCFRPCRTSSYLKELKDSGEEITPKAWQREIDLLTAQKQVDTIDMKAMREELKAVERLRKAADQLARQEQDKSHDRGPER